MSIAVVVIVNVAFSTLIAFFAYKSGWHKAMSMCCRDVADELDGITRAHGDAAWEKVPAMLTRLAQKWKVG